MTNEEFIPYMLVIICINMTIFGIAIIAKLDKLIEILKRDL